MDAQLVGNSGTLDEWVSNEINKNNLTVCSVLSTETLKEESTKKSKQIFPSPPLVVAYAIAGNININLLIL